MELAYLFVLQLCSFALFYARTTHAATARILVYTATQQFRHDSIPTALEALKAKQASIDVEFENTEDPSQFTDSNLANYDALIFLSTTGEDVALQRYFNLGGNFVGIHSASDTLRNSTAYINQLGSRFDYHADLQNFTVNVIDGNHPSTSILPTNWVIPDEVYNFEIDPRSLGATVVLAADESTVVDNGVRRFDQGTPHPLAWFAERGAGVQAGNVAGRSFYTSLGHLNETWRDELFISHVIGGISWVLQGNTTRAYNSSAQVGSLQASGSSSLAGSPPSTATTTSPPPSGSQNTSSYVSLPR
ncbi:unnamed protein product [Cyclocybe aegerita]|uniref:ThuA-like domain-containing protein n=1 Tax=Cyclocybe aegerita TaxID=1973307 RepID=A0A8S0XWE8_CYCAE|nr:unnamed protein product [Cyclocybe aegerita]